MKPRSIRRKVTEKTAVVYANDSWIGRTQWDIQLNFGHGLALPPGEPVPSSVEIPSAVTVIMSVEHAVAFNRFLSEVLAKIGK